MNKEILLLGGPKDETLERRLTARRFDLVRTG